MKTYLMLAAGLLLSAPLALAQAPATPATPAKPAIPATPATPTDPAIPATPAEPAVPATPADPTHKPGTTKPEAKGSAKAAGNLGDFASFDANGDGSLSRDEVKGRGAIEGSFGSLDRNSDGTVTRGEFESGQKASAHKEKSKQ